MGGAPAGLGHRVLGTVRVRAGGSGASTVSADPSLLPQGCQHNTEGDHCEHCRAGFVRSGSEDPMAPCVSCPCPLAVPSNK